MLQEIKKIGRYDQLLLLCLVLFAGFSLLAVYSATYASDSALIHDNFNKQILWIFLGFACFFIFSRIPTSYIYSSAYVAYGILIILLLLLDVFGSIGGGARRWFEIGGIKVQPSEFMKPVLVLAFARFLSDENRSPNVLKNLGIAFTLLLIPFALVIQQPDLGTALVYLAVAIPVLYWRGLSPFVIFVLCSPALVFISSFNIYSFSLSLLILSVVLYLSGRDKRLCLAIGIANVFVGVSAPLIWNHLHTYQQKRILTFLGLVSDPQGVGYQIIQSKVAIGSGGFLGKGLLQGTQTQLRFLPAQHTDFIFSVLAEEWGFLGALLVLGTLLYFLLRCFKIASSTSSRFSSLMIIGLVTIFAFQIILNVGMTMGIMPVTGVPLPFISYGGSAMLTNMATVGLISSVASRH